MARSSTVLFIDTAPRVGGGQVSLLALLAGLDRERFRPLVAAPPHSGTAAAMKALAIPLLPLEISSRTAAAAGDQARAGWLQEPQRWARALALGRAWIAERHVDLIHAKNTKAGLLGVLLATWTRRRLVYHHRVEETRRGATRWVAARAARVICVSLAASEGLGASAAKVRIVHDGIDVERFKPPARGPARPMDAAARIMVVGRLSREKGQDIFLEAAARVARKCPRARFTLAGEAFLSEDVAFEAQLRRRAQASDLHGRVEFVGFTPDVPRFLSATDIVVCPSRREGMGLAALEAMACELPVVASAVGGLRESVVGDVTGLLVPAMDPEALATAIEALVNDPARRRRMGSAGRARVREHFTQKTMVDGVEAVYVELLADATHRPAAG